MRNMVLMRSICFFCMNLCEYPYICYVYVCHFKKKMNKNRVKQLCNFKIKNNNGINASTGNMVVNVMIKATNEVIYKKRQLKKRNLL